VIWVGSSATFSFFLFGAVEFKQDIRVVVDVLSNNSINLFLDSPAQTVILVIDDAAVFTDHTDQFVLCVVLVESESTGGFVGLLCDVTAVVIG